MNCILSEAYGQIDRRERGKGEVGGGVWTGRECARRLAETHAKTCQQDVLRLAFVTHHCTGCVLCRQVLSSGLRESKGDARTRVQAGRNLIW
jgi:hypothetical protein